MESHIEYCDEQTKCVKQYGPNNSHENNWLFMPHPKCCKNITSTIPLPTIQEQEGQMSTSQIPQPNLITLVSINKKRQDSKLFNWEPKQEKKLFLNSCAKVWKR
jgi:hypothetical protein